MGVVEKAAKVEAEAEVRRWRKAGEEAMADMVKEAVAGAEAREAVAGARRLPARTRGGRPGRARPGGPRVMHVFHPAQIPRLLRR